MNNMFDNFTQQYLDIGAGFIQNAVEVANAYIAYNKGSTTGKLKLYAYLQAIPEVSKQRGNFVGLRLKSTEATNDTAIIQEQPMSAYEREMLKLAKEKTERKLKEQERLAKEKAEEQERLAKEKAEEQERLARWREEDKEQQERFHRDELELPKALAQMKIEHQERLQKADHAYLTKENNKNRLINVMTHHNEFRDLLMYGTPSTVIADSESAMKLVSYSMYDHTNIHKQTIVDLVKDAIGLVASEQPVIRNGKEERISAITEDDVSKLVETVEDRVDKTDLQVIKVAVRNLAQKINEAKEIVKSDFRHVESEKTIDIAKQDPNKHKTQMQKIKYVRACNKLRTVPAADGTVSTVINCYCCDKELDLHSSACHRAHNIPRSKGGDWSFDNIYLTCANCNEDMRDVLHVIDYKTELFARISQ